MGQRLVADRAGLFTLEVLVEGPILDDALEHSDAEEVLKSAVIAALAVLAQEGPWPNALLETMWQFMDDMRRTLRAERMI